MLKRLSLVATVGIGLGSTALLVHGADQAADKKPSGSEQTAVKAADLKPDADGFVEIFNGKDLTGWEGLEGFWSVKDGAIVGKETKEGSRQTDLILLASKDHPERFANFELHLKYQLVSKQGNSGIQFRGKIDKPKDLHVGGYQADIDDSGHYVGTIYDEGGIAGGRATMSNRGERTVWTAE